MTEARPHPTASSATAWRVLGLESADAETLLAQGAALLDSLAADPTPTLRWYRATTPALVLGRGQPVPQHVADSLTVVSRYSGGGAVLMDSDLLSLDLAIPASHPLLAGGLGDVFLRIGQIWAAALDDLSVRDLTVHGDPSSARRRGSAREQLIAAICYATLGRGEVASAGRKLVGLAQRRRRPGALVQCGLLRRWNPEPLLAAIGEAGPDPELAARAVGLDDLVEPAVSDESVMSAVQRRLEDRYG